MGGFEPFKKGLEGRKMRREWQYAKAGGPTSRAVAIPLQAD
jgi:hypothetical protein